MIGRNFIVEFEVIFYSVRAVENNTGRENVYDTNISISPGGRVRTEGGYSFESRGVFFCSVVGNWNIVLWKWNDSYPLTVLYLSKVRPLM